MGKRTDTCGRMKLIILFSATTKLTILSYTSSRETKIELLILVSDFMVNSMLKNTQGYFCEMQGIS